jgi:ribosome maturation factor RimP
MRESEKEEIHEEVYYKRFLGKYIKVVLRLEKREQYYRGQVIQILKDKLILEDRKLGQVPIPYKGLIIQDVNDKGWD